MAYPSALSHPDLCAIDFPYLRGKPTRDSLSHPKAALYDQALELDEPDIAEAILGTWRDAIMRSTHFVYDRDAEGQPLIASANKLTRRTQPIAITPWLGQRLVAFTMGAGRKNRTAAFNAVIGRANQLDLIPHYVSEERPRADLRHIARLQLLYIEAYLRKQETERPYSRNFMLTSYDDEGYFIPLADGEKEPSKELVMIAAEGRRKKLFPNAAALWRPDKPPLSDAEITFEQLEALAQLEQPLQPLPDRAEQLADPTLALLEQF